MKTEDCRIQQECLRKQRRNHELQMKMLDDEYNQMDSIYAKRQQKRVVIVDSSQKKEDKSIPNASIINNNNHTTSKHKYKQSPLLIQSQYKGDLRENLDHRKALSTNNNANNGQIPPIPLPITTYPMTLPPQPLSRIVQNTPITIQQHPSSNYMSSSSSSTTQSTSIQSRIRPSPTTITTDYRNQNFNMNTNTSNLLPPSHQHQHQHQQRQIMISPKGVYQNRKTSYGDDSNERGIDLLCHIHPFI